MTDTALYADVILPATTFLEGYDFARAYGPISLELGRPVIDAVGESRSNADVFGELCARLGVLARTTNRQGSSICWSRCSMRCPATSPTTCARAPGPRRRSATGPIQFVDVFPEHARSEGRSVPGGARHQRAGGPVSLPARSGDGALSAGAHLAGERADDQLDARRAAAARRQADDASRTMRRREG